MKHDWELMKTPLDDVPDVIAKKNSDVWFCKQCHQISLSEVGSPADDNFYNVEDCGTAIVRQVLES